MEVQSELISQSSPAKEPIGSRSFSTALLPNHVIPSRGAEQARLVSVSRTLSLSFAAVAHALRNDGFLQPGMIGTAKVRVGQRSLAGFGLRFVRDFASRKIW